MLSLKKTEKYISILCGCGCRIFYPPAEDGLKHSSLITKNEYRGSKNGK
jgi:hypothetical protein